MTTPPTPLSPAAEEYLAELASAAYQVALRHGLRAPFIDVELDLWRALRSVVLTETLAAGDGEFATPGEVAPQPEEDLAWQA